MPLSLDWAPLPPGTFPCVFFSSLRFSAPCRQYLQINLASQNQTTQSHPNGERKSPTTFVCRRRRRRFVACTAKRDREEAGHHPLTPPPFYLYRYLSLSLSHPP